MAKGYVIDLRWKGILVTALPRGWIQKGHCRCMFTLVRREISSLLPVWFRPIIINAYCGHRVSCVQGTGPSTAIWSLIYSREMAAKGELVLWSQSCIESGAQHDGTSVYLLRGLYKKAHANFHLLRGLYKKAHANFYFCNCKNQCMNTMQVPVMAIVWCQISTIRASAKVYYRSRRT